MSVEGDKVGVRFTMQGANTVPFLDREASGKTLMWPGIAIYRVLDDKIAEEWILWSGYDVYSQIRGWQRLRLCILATESKHLLSSRLAVHPPGNFGTSGRVRYSFSQAASSGCPSSGCPTC